jgi:hypothetical protein
MTARARARQLHAWAGGPALWRHMACHRSSRNGGKPLLGISCKPHATHQKSRRSRSRHGNARLSHGLRRQLRQWDKCRWQLVDGSGTKALPGRRKGSLSPAHRQEADFPCPGYRPRDRACGTRVESSAHLSHFGGVGKRSGFDAQPRPAPGAWMLANRGLNPTTERQR